MEITLLSNMLMVQKPPKITGPLSIAVELKAPDKRRRDLDNFGAKAIIDLLYLLWSLRLYRNWTGTASARAVRSLPPLSNL